MRALQRARRDEWIVNDDRCPLTKITVVLALRTNGIAEEVLQNVRRRPHVEVSSHETSAIFVVLLDAVAFYVLPGDDGITFIEVTGE